MSKIKTYEEWNSSGLCLSQYLCVGDLSVAAARAAAERGAL